ncbi:hypothetical protein Xen7305DRAFT_00003970 [Xenococcus sp. PCC 7305]|uniref:hypothetical protein n=1 Tax=Xenococcus sp. PCC 7305 TaxID=102125 RepID=UPI0002AC5387|nr:hypothetical protein [Xenococcus sp. PCC 7305]ELS00696.1 hypothetical protein Xen7305DRAFT_00003970 [Xenococcus sp. PCC 7305]
MFLFQSKIYPLLSLVLFLGLFTPTIQAQEIDPEEVKQENFENSIRKIGLAAGYASQCYIEQDDQEAVERIGDEALAVAEIILQDFGSTLAFLFTSNAGYGAGKPTDLSNCDQLILDWQELVESFSEAEE